MNKKLLKLGNKILLMMPLFILLYFVSFGIYSIKWFSVLVYAFFISSAIVFNNWFDYEKFDQMEIKDFLESIHSKSITKNEILNIEELYSKLKTKYNVKQISSKSLEIQANNGLNNSVISVELIDDSLLIKIKRKYVSFFPDNAKNYKMLEDFIRENKATTNRGLS